MGRLNKYLLIFLVSLSLISIASAEQINITFNGDWANNVSLFSDSIYVNNGFIFGSDVYPITVPQTRVQSCVTTYKEKTKRVCEIVVVDGRRRRQCHIETYQIPKTVCRWTTSPPVTYACLNPNGEYTNQLRLENFKFSIDNSTTWQPVPYEATHFNNYTRMFLNNITAIFRVDIPPVCSPTYEINKSIKIITIP